MTDIKIKIENVGSFYGAGYYKVKYFQESVEKNTDLIPILETKIINNVGGNIIIITVVDIVNDEIRFTLTKETYIHPPYGYYDGEINYPLGFENLL